MKKRERMSEKEETARRSIQRRIFVELQQLTSVPKRDLAKSVDIISIWYCECPNYIIWRQFKLGEQDGWGFVITGQCSGQRARGAVGRRKLASMVVSLVDGGCVRGSCSIADVREPCVSHVA